MNTRYKYHYKSGLYFLNFPSNVIQKTVFTDGFESMSSWKKYVYSDTWIPINNSQDINFDKNPFGIAFGTNTIGIRTRASRTEYWKYWEKIETQYVTKFRKLRRE
jgi:hypothetical protein